MCTDRCTCVHAGEPRWHICMSPLHQGAMHTCVARLVSDAFYMQVCQRWAPVGPVPKHTPVSEPGASNSTIVSEGPPVLACGDCFCPSPQAQEVNMVISGCLQMRRLRRREVT